MRVLRRVGVLSLLQALSLLANPHALGQATVNAAESTSAEDAAPKQSSTSAPSAASAPDRPDVASAPDQAELEASEALLDTSKPEPEKPPPSPASSANIYELTSTTLLTAKGGEPQTSLLLSDNGWRVGDLLRPRGGMVYPSAALSFYTEIEVADWLLVRGLLDTRQIRDGATLEPPLSGVTMNGNPALKELRSGNLIRELSAVIGHDAFTAEVGRFRSDVADGLVYKDFGTGARVRVDLDVAHVAPLQGELLLTTVGQRVDSLGNNGLASLRLDWVVSPFEYVGAFVAVSEDKNGEVSDVLRSAYAETLIPDQQKLSSLFLQDQGHGKQSYAGLLAQLVTSNAAVLRARAVLSGGSLYLNVPLSEVTTAAQALDHRQIKVKAEGLAADLELRYGLSDAVEVSGFAFLLSGDTPPKIEGGRYRSFIGLSPYWVWSGLFFSGGLAQGLYPNRAAAAGVEGRGVFGLGPSLALRRSVLRSELRALLLRSTAAPPAPPLGGTSHGYGTEVDWLTRWETLTWLALGAEIDLFFPGHFFPSQRVAYLALGMVTISNAR